MYYSKNAGEVRNKLNQFTVYIYAYTGSLYMLGLPKISIPICKENPEF